MKNIVLANTVLVVIASTTECTGPQGSNKYSIHVDKPMPTASLSDDLEQLHIREFTSTFSTEPLCNGIVLTTGEGKWNLNAFGYNEQHELRATMTDGFTKKEVVWVDVQAKDMPELTQKVCAVVKEQGGQIGESQ